MRNFIFCILFLETQSILYAQNQLGYIYYEGEGIVQDKSEAVKWFRKATEQGNGSAMLNIGGLYANVDVVPQDMNEAIKWYRLVAGQRDADMEFYLPSNNNDTIIVDDNTIYDNVEQMPDFPGGISALMRFLSKNIIYPKEAEGNGIQGRVIVSFVVEKDGSITDIKVEKPLDRSTDKEAIRVVKLMPKWIPGKHDGTKVRVRHILPITFRLQ